MTDDLYCRVYVAHATDVAALRTLVAQVAAGGGVVGLGVATPALSVRVGAQSRHELTSDEGDDFVRWPHWLEIDARDDGVTADAFVAEVAQLLVGLRRRGLRTVASCAFEDELAAAMRALG